MARVITLKLTGLAEKFIAEMEKQGLNEADVIAQGIGILEEVWRTQRVALVKNEFLNDAQKNAQSAEQRNAHMAATDGDDKFIEHYFHIQTPESMGLKSNSVQ